MDSLNDIFGPEFVKAISKTKICGICKKDLPVANFGKDGGANYLRYECKSCAKQMSKTVARIKKTAPPVPDDHICPICERNAKEALGYNKNRKSPWCADHDHSTGEFRGWICHQDNLTLGALKDNIKRVQNLYRYLKKSKQPPTPDNLPPALFDN